MSRRQKYDSLKNTFPLPNEVFLLGLCPGELAVYTFLLRSANRKTQQCWPSYKTIGKAVGMTENTVAKHVGSLEAKGLICTEPTTVTTKAGKKRNGNLKYTLLPVSEAMDCYMERQIEAARLEAAKQRAAKKLEKFDRTHPA